MIHHITTKELQPVELLAFTGEQFSVSDEWLLLQDAVIQTDLEFKITGWNSAAEVLYGFSDAHSKNLFDLVDLTFVKCSLDELK
jgi:PAS domain-containing protein